MLIFVALVIGATPASAGRLAGGGPDKSAFIFAPLQPAPPTGLTATVASSTEVDLSWTAPTGIPAASYNVYKGPSSGNEDTSTTVNPNPITTGTTFQVTGLSPSTTYYFAVTAVDRGGNESSLSDDVPATTPAASAIAPPTGLTAKVVSSTEVDLSWTAPTGIPAASYNVYKGPSSGNEDTTTTVNPAPITGTTTFKVTNLSPSTTYYFAVTAVDRGGNESSLSDDVPATTPAASAIAPPTGLTATVASSSEIDLSWTAPTGVPAASYNVYQGTSPGNEDTTAVNPAPITGTTNFKVMNLSSSTPYYFEVTAVDRGGNESNPSGEASATTAGTGPGGSSVSPWLFVVPLAALGAAGGALVAVWRRRSRLAAGRMAHTVPRRDTHTAHVPDTHAPAGPGTHTVPAPGTQAAPAPGTHTVPAPGTAPAPGTQAAPAPGIHAAATQGIHAAAGHSIRAVPHADPPPVISIHATGTDPTRTVQFVPHPGTSIITTEEAPRQ
jgi:fibronectin type 3 domain-containing protein